MKHMSLDATPAAAGSVDFDRRCWLAGGALSLFAPSLLAAPSRTPADQLVVVQDLSTITSLDPAAAISYDAMRVLEQCYETLLRFGAADGNKVEPTLAESFEIDAAQRRLRLRLRASARFASGNPVTAGDAAWSLQRVLKLKKGADSVLVARGFSAATADADIRALDERTLELRMPGEEAPQPLLNALCSAITSVVERAVVEPMAKDGDMGHAWLASRSAGSGPFAISRWAANEVVVLERTAAHWRTKPAMRRILIRHIAEPGVRALMMRSGDADIALELTADDLAGLEREGQARVHRFLQSRFFYLMSNTEVPALADPAVRRALQQMVDVDTIARAVLKGHALPLRSLLLREAIEPPPRDTVFDAAAARAAFERAKVGPLKMLTLAQPPFAELAQAVQAGARQCGLTIEVETLVGAQLFPRLRARRYELALAAFSPANPDPSIMTDTLVINADNSAQGNSASLAWRAGWQDNELMQLAREAGRMPDAAERMAKYRRIDTLFAQRTPVAPLFQPISKVAHAPQVRGFLLTPYRTSLVDVVKS